MGMNESLTPPIVRTPAQLGRYEQLKAEWRRFFDDEAILNSAYVKGGKWCLCGSGRDLKTLAPVLGRIFYFNDGVDKGWACIKCKRVCEE